MDKELENIMQLKSYMNINPTLQHPSGAVDYFWADVEYLDSSLENMYLHNTEIHFEHGYHNSLNINELRPPYYGYFWLSKQNFEYKDGRLYISGARQDNGGEYMVIIG